MTRFQPILLDVWREACRHIEIDESVERIFQLVSQELDLAALAVYRYEHERHEDAAAFHLAASVGIHHDHFPGSLRWTPRSGDLGRWQTEGTLRPARELSFSVGGQLIGEEGLVAPLTVEGTLVGILVVVPDSGGQGVGVSVDPALQEKAAMLVEPFAVAAANDRRLREVTVLREAAEAERSTLLTKLGMRRLEQRIIGAQGGLSEVLSRVALVARTDTPVLIFGETGTGKEVIAREIHSQSERTDGPFMRVNCGAISPGLIDSELFGHERGSFTGAHKTRAGWFERADGGTLFLDEIGELPPDAQVRLLRVLQDGHFERVGGHHEVGVDVRVVAATHRDLSSMVAEGRFRQDLWYRLAVFPIELPPLRERKEDIPELARHFAERASRRFGLPLQLPNDTGLDAMVAYDWPGNIRELAAVVDRAAILGNGHSLEIRAALGMAAPGSWTDRTRVPSPVRFGGAPAPQNRPGEAVLPLDDAIRRHIILALDTTNGKVEGTGGAADLLRVNPSTLRSRMRKLGIAVPKPDTNMEAVTSSPRQQVPRASGK
jgi:transcriptional regulator with GAF, ATPase, and Fis domain